MLESENTTSTQPRNSLPRDTTSYLYLFICCGRRYSSVMTRIVTRCPCISTAPTSTDRSVFLRRTFTIDKCRPVRCAADLLASLSTALLCRLDLWPLTQRNSMGSPVRLATWSSYFHRTACATGFPSRVIHLLLCQLKRAPS